MKCHIFLTLALILVPITLADETTIEPVPAEAVAEASGKDPDVAAIADQPGDPPIPQEETHLAPAEAAEVPPAEAAKIESEDKKDVAAEDTMAKEEKVEEVVEKKEEAEAKKEEADPKIPAPVKAAHKKTREGHHKGFLAHHMERLRKLIRTIVSRIFRHKKAKHGRSLKG